MKELWDKARKSFTVYSATIIAIAGVIQVNLGMLQLTPRTQGLVLIGIGIVVAMARLRPKGA